MHPEVGISIIYEDELRCVAPSEGSVGVTSHSNSGTGNRRDQLPAFSSRHRLSKGAARDSLGCPAPPGARRDRLSCPPRHPLRVCVCLILRHCT